MWVFQGKPPGFASIIARTASQFALASAISSGVTGRLPAGKANCGVRWSTVTCAASRAISGIAWIPEEPVPITATRFPAKETGS